MEEIMASKKEVGSIINIYNNYGVISCGDDILPFEITKSMLKVINGIEYVEYTKEVKFKYKHSTDIRGRKIYDAQEIEFIGDKFELKERTVASNYLQLVRKKFYEFNFKIPDKYSSDDKLYEYLKDIGFQPRMLNYLVSGVFVPKSQYEALGAKVYGYLSPELIPIIDRIDGEFRVKILKWITNIEDSYKSYISRVLTNKYMGKNISKNIIKRLLKVLGLEKNKQKYRFKYKYTEIYDNFDYANNPNTFPIENLLDELNLSDLRKVVSIFIEESRKKGFFSPYLKPMQESLNSVTELSTLRNNAAHGKPLVPNFSNVDFNANIDLEYFNTEQRTDVSKWFLFDPLKKDWEEKGLDTLSIKQILNTLYNNPCRKAWIELNYIYLSIINHINPAAFDIFQQEAEVFLKYDIDVQKQIKDVDLTNLRLSDMGSTTLEMATGVPAPYKEIANEAYSVWNAFHKTTNFNLFSYKKMLL